MKKSSKHCDFTLYSEISLTRNLYFSDFRLLRCYVKHVGLTNNYTLRFALQSEILAMVRNIRHAHKMSGWNSVVLSFEVDFGLDFLLAKKNQFLAV